MAHPDDPSVPQPCPVPVDSMEPKERGHLCHRCETMVLDTARYTRDEFLALVRTGEKVCAQLRKDEVGRVRFLDSPMRRRLQVVALSAALAACGDDVDPPVGTVSAPTPPTDERVGRVAPPSTTPRSTPPPSAPAPGPHLPSAPPDPSLPDELPADPGLVAPPADEAPHAESRRGRVRPPMHDEVHGLVEED